MKNRFLKAVLALVLCAVMVSSADARVIKVGHTGTKDHYYQMYLEKWAEAVTTRTEGRYTFEIYPSDLYGKPNQLIEGCQLGTSDMVLATGSLLSAYSKIVGVLDLPFLFASEKEASYVLNGPIGDELSASLAEKNLIVLAWWENGMRHLFPPRPVNTPEDMKGLKLRVINSKPMIETINAMGAIAVPMGFNDVYSAWQMKTIDGCEGTITHMLTQKYYELTKTGTLLWYMHVPNPLIMSKKLWSRIPDADKEIFIDEAKKMSIFSFEFQANADEGDIKKCEDLGVVFTRPDRTPFIEACKPVYEIFRPDYGDMIDRIIEEAKKAN